MSTTTTPHDERVDLVGDQIAALRDQFPRATTDADSRWMAAELLADTEILTVFAEALADRHPDVLRSIAARVERDLS